MSETATWRAVGPWDTVITAGHYGERRDQPGVLIEPMSGFGIVYLLAAPGGGEDASAKFFDRYGVRLPQRPEAVRGARFDVVWAAPEQWFVVSPERGLHSDLSSMAEHLAVSDHSGARALLRISGRKFRSALAKGCSLDLDPRVFTAGTAATTSISLIGVNLWRLPDEDAIHIALFRSMAGSFWSWLAASAAEWGVEVSPAKYRSMTPG